MSIWIWLGVALLGGLAALARHALSSAVALRGLSAYPYGTLAVNASASCALGLVTGLALSGTALLLVGTAAIGSYSTFSTWMFETHRLSEDAEILAAVINVIASVTIGVAAAALGRVIGAAL
jgi:CrcB protein